MERSHTERSRRGVLPGLLGVAIDTSELFDEKLQESQGFYN
jgi:hypothetical protein